MQTEVLLKIIQDVLDEHKGQNIVTLDVIKKSSFTDYMVVVTGTSDRHLHALCDYASDKSKENGVRPLGIEGGLGSGWVLLDLGDIIVHAMTDQARDFYQLEKLWSVGDVKEIQKQAG
ncbi:ribosome silencing factor [Crenothrix sp.]|uniref:ribosome silencing factor n=1 Tax=Crenothrix sp. TaxID=3100433 RepID=UPI00374D8768